MEFIENAYGQKFDWDTVVNLMDDEIREQVHDEIAPCTPQEFYNRYCALHLEKYGDCFGFEYSNPQY